MLKSGNNLWLINSIVFGAVFAFAALTGGAILYTDGFGAFGAAAQTFVDPAAVVADTVPPLVYNIDVGDPTPTSTMIRWETNELSDSLVNFGLDKRYGVVRDPRADKTAHSIQLENLQSDTVYYFRITSSDASGNQGISSDFSFTTKPDPDLEDLERAPGTTDLDSLKGEGGLSEQGIEQVVQAIQAITSTELLERIEEEITKQAEEVAKPPTIILDMAQLEIGTDYAIINWLTDKESSSMVAIAAERDYRPDNDDPYDWKVGEPNEQTTEHTVTVVGLRPATVYHFQVSSEDSLGLTGKSEDKTFKTKSILPEIFNIRMAKIEEEAATIKFSTNVPCSVIIEYTNLTTNETKLEGNSSFLTVHSMQLTNLTFDTYYSAVIRVESEDGEKAQSDPVTFITIKDVAAPLVAKVNTESTLYPGTENKIQTIASWQTDEPAQCQLFYHQGLVLIDDPMTLPKEEDFATKHVQVVTNFLPSTVYKFWIICNDEAKNNAKSEDFTMLTPSQEESIIDIIIKNFESSFGWVKKVGG